MFQFRPFPSYAYFIQRMIPEFCSGGFPHSEIHGFSGYLLLPVAYRSLTRPSSAPDAKAFPLRSFQLDRRRVKLRSLRFRLSAKTPYRSVAPPLPHANASLVCVRRKRTSQRFALSVPTLSFRDLLVLFRIMQAILRKFFVSKLLPYTFRCSPQLKL